MRYIKLFEYYNDIESICKKYVIEKYTISNSGLVDVDSTVFITHTDLNKLPLNFGRVNDHFYCDNNKFTTLEGAPTYVDGLFDCSYNNLTSLEYSPKVVNGYYNCSHNNLENLKGVSEEINESLYIENNKINTLNYIKGVKGRLHFVNNNFPNIIVTYLRKGYFNLIIKYQDEYNIWNKDDTLNIQRFNLMIEDIESE